MQLPSYTFTVYNLKLLTTKKLLKIDKLNYQMLSFEITKFFTLIAISYLFRTGVRHNPGIVSG